MSNKEYETFRAFLSEITLYAYMAKTKYTDFIPKIQKKTVLAGIKKMVERLESEMIFLKSCPECYGASTNDDDVSFLEPCTKPHVVVWIDCDDYGFWPAKIMKYNDKDDMVYVIFFGDRTNSHVSAKKCFLYSKEIPENPKGKGCGDTFDLAIQVN